MLTSYIIHDIFGLIVVFSIYGDVVMVSLGTCHCTWPMCQLTFGWSDVNTLARSKHTYHFQGGTGLGKIYFAMPYIAGSFVNSQILWKTYICVNLRR